MFQHITDQISQIYPPKPSFTETDLPDLKNKVKPGQTAVPSHVPPPKPLPGPCKQEERSHSHQKAGIRRDRRQHRRRQGTLQDALLQERTRIHGRPLPGKSPLRHGRHQSLLSPVHRRPHLPPPRPRRPNHHRRLGAPVPQQRAQAPRPLQQRRRHEPARRLRHETRLRAAAGRQQHRHLPFHEAPLRPARRDSPDRRARRRARSVGGFFRRRGTAGSQRRRRHQGHGRASQQGHLHELRPQQSRQLPARRGDGEALQGQARAEHRFEPWQFGFGAVEDADGLCVEAAEDLCAAPAQEWRLHGALCRLVTIRDHGSVRWLGWALGSTSDHTWRFEKGCRE